MNKLILLLLLLLLPSAYADNYTIIEWGSSRVSDSDTNNNYNLSYAVVNQPTNMNDNDDLITNLGIIYPAVNIIIETYSANGGKQLEQIREIEKLLGLNIWYVIAFLATIEMFLLLSYRYIKKRKINKGGKLEI